MARAWAHLFVAAGAANYTFAEATLTVELPAWIKLHVHAFEFFGGVYLFNWLIADNSRSPPGPLSSEITRPNGLSDRLVTHGV
jgi:hypothetical protein